MQRSEALKHFTAAQLDEVSYVNPLEVFSNIEFNRREQWHDTGPKLDYRERSLNRAVKSGLHFHSTENHITTMAKTYLAPICPYCSKSMKFTQSGGNCAITSMTYNCECGATMSITLSHDAIGVCPPPQPKASSENAS